MAKLSRDLGGDTLHPRETLFGTGVLGGVGAEVVIAADGCACVCLDMRGTYSLTAEVSGSVDGVNWTIIPVRLIAGASPVYIAAIAGSLSGVWSGALYGFRLVRVRCTAFVNGAASVTLTASTAAPDASLSGMVTPNLGTIIGAVGAATTLTLAAPGLGLRHYLTYLSINRFAATVLTAGAVPVAVTTTNLPGALAFTFEADAAPLGTMVRWREDFAFPLVASAPNSVTTIACPATPGVIWRVTAGFYLGG
ncbi:MAG: hypothetical protein AABY88_02805 [Pseudomonadota bacterium]